MTQLTETQPQAPRRLDVVPEPGPKPGPDKGAILSALDAMFAPEDVIELRAFPKGKKGVSAGYFDGAHKGALAEEAVRLNSAGAAVYVTLNKIDPQLLARCYNRVGDYAKATVTDKDVGRRRWLLIDFDPVRPADTSATDVQVAAAIERARAAYHTLKAEGWPRPLVGESGNGMHLLYALDLPNDTESTALVKGALAGLAARFDDQVVTVDQAVYNAGRITKLFGTVATKGDHTPLTPWRLSRVVSGADRDVVVTVEQLRALHPKGNGEPAGDYSAGTWYEGKDFDVPGLLGALDLSWKEEPYQGGTIYKLDDCPFNREHVQGDAAVIVRADGTICFHCFHKGCIDKGWQDVRALRDGPRKARGGAPHWTRQSGYEEAPAGDFASPEPPHPMPPDAYYGIAGEIVNTLDPHTESDPAAILFQVLAAFGVLVGRSPYMQVEGDRHYPNLFGLLVGETSKGRKGTSWGRVRSIFERVHSWPRVVSGLSSGEGLKWQVRDPRTEMVKDKKSGVTREEVVDEGVTDKRLLVIEPEFAQVLRVVARHGNTLSPTVRTAWDTGALATLTKNDPVTATDAHIAIIGHITIDELRAELTQTDTANGFANRFLFVYVKRSKCLPFGGEDLLESKVADFAQRLEREASAARRVGRVPMTQAARDIWVGVYPRLSEGMPGLFGAATARAEAQVLRLAMLYALLDEKAQIDIPHLLAALAVWEYAEAGARHVFGSSLGDPVADETLRAARSAGQDGMTRTQIRDLFKRNCSAARIGAALDLLARRNLVRRRTEETGGRPSEVWVSV
jgi:hypothetical protein